MQKIHPAAVELNNLPMHWRDLRRRGRPTHSLGDLLAKGSASVELLLRVATPRCKHQDQLMIDFCPVQRLTGSFSLFRRSHLNERIGNRPSGLIDSPYHGLKNSC